MSLKRTLLLVAAVLIILGCYDYTNPLDPESTSYQGWSVYADGEDIPADAVFSITGISPADDDTTIDISPLLNWDDMIGVAAYQIRTAATEEGLSSATTVDAGTASEYQYPLTLLPGDVLCWQVQAVNEHGKSPWSGAVSFTIPTPPITLSGISPADGTTLSTTNAPLLDWDDVNGTVSYEIRYAATAAGLSGAAPVTGLTVSEYQYPLDLSHNEEVWWNITAVNDEGNEFLSGNYSLVAAPGIGDTYAGGIIFYLDGTGGGFICAESDQGTGIEWGGYGVTVSGTSSAMGTGAANTAKIVATYGDAEPYSGLTNYAAKLCYDLELNGYDDWFLPSLDELHMMYNNLHLLGLGDFDSDYWSSSEDSYLEAWKQSFGSDGQFSSAKKFGYKVRAVRAF